MTKREFLKTKNFIQKKAGSFQKTLRGFYVYNALIQPHFNYACVAWYPNLNKKYENKLQVLQNKCIYFCLQLDNIQHIRTEHFRKISWLPIINQRLKQFLSASVLKFFSEMCLQYMNEIYRTTNQNNTVTRNSSLVLNFNKAKNQDLWKLSMIFS